MVAMNKKKSDPSKKAGFREDCEAVKETLNALAQCLRQ
jgi:hypothetical protein